MRFFSKSALSFVVLALGLTTQVFAAPMITTGNSKNEVLSNITSSSLRFGGGNTRFSLNAGYNYALDPALMVGGVTTFSVGTGGTVFGLIVGPTINFPFDMDIKNSFYVFIGAGFLIQPAANSFAWQGEIGKRFQLLENVIYRPSFSAGKNGGSDISFALNVLQFSFIF